MRSDLVKKICMIICLVLISLVFSCEEEETVTQPVTVDVPTVQVTEDLDPVDSPEYSEALVTFLSGDVEISRGEEVMYVDIGDTVTTEDILMVGDNAYCELQFAETAVVRVQENTEVLLQSVLMAPEQTRIGIDVAVGSVLCKVEGLAGNQRFRVRTETATMGVRGTQFGVSVSETRGTTLAVREGRVSMLPPAAADVEDLTERAGDAREAVEQVIQQIEESAPTFGADEEVSVNQESFREANQELQQIQQTVEEIVARVEQAAEEDEAEDTQEQEEDVEEEPVQELISADELAQLSAAVHNASSKMQEEAAQSREISDERKTALEEIEKMEIFRFAPEAAVEAGTEEEQEAAPVPQRLVRMQVVAYPEDATIVLNNARTAVGRLSGVFQPGRELEILVARQDYVSETLYLEVPEERGQAYEVRLRQIPEEPVEEEEIEEPEGEEQQTLQEEVPETAALEIDVEPGNAVLTINGEEAEYPYSGEFELGQEIALAVTAEGFEAFEETFDITGDEEVEIELTALPEEPEETEVREEQTEEQEAAAAVEEEAPEPSEYAFTVRVRPNDARLYIENVFVGTGEHSGTYLEGSNVRIRAERDGYANVRITQSISESTPAMRIIELEPRPIEGDYHIADSPIIGEILRFGNVFVAVSADGRLIGFESGGAVSWVNETANTENRNNQPVAAAGRVVLTGGIEMVVNDPQSGSELVQRSLPSSDNHMFGRRVVPFPGGLLFPRNRGIDLVSLETGETYEEIAIPRAAGMTPGYYDEIIIMCNQRGDMFFYNESGEMIGEVETPADQIRALSPVVHEGRVYLANRKGLVVCVDLDSRSLVWDRDVDPDANMQVFHDLVVTDYGIFMYDLRHNIVYALNTENGQELYPPIQNVSCPPGVAGGELLYGTMTDDFIIAEADTGRDVSSLNVDANVVTRPSVYEGRILVGTDNGRVLVINPAGLE